MAKREVLSENQMHLIAKALADPRRYEITPPATVVYTATKRPWMRITHVLAKELGPKKIRVNCINPGVAETEGTHAVGLIGSDVQNQLQAQTPLGRICAARGHCADRCFLASGTQDGCPAKPCLHPADYGKSRGWGPFLSGQP